MFARKPLLHISSTGVIDRYNNVIPKSLIADFAIQMVRSAWNAIIAKVKISRSKTVNVKTHAQTAIGLIDSTILIAMNVQTLKFNTQQTKPNASKQLVDLIRKFLKMESVRTVLHISC